MRLIDLYRKNETLRVVDAPSGEVYDLSQLLAKYPLFGNEGRALVFLYMDNGLDSLGALLGLLEGPHVGALFSNAINERQRQALETLYQPAMIYDADREVIEGYETTEHEAVFRNSKATEINLADEIKLLLSTSGSTGSPKLVKLSEGNLISNAEAIVDYLPINAADVCPLNLPLTYSYGLSVLNSNALAGGKLVTGLADIMTPHFWKAFDKYGFTSLAGVPVVYEILKRFKFTRKDYPSLRYLTQAGGKLSDALIAEFYEYAHQRDLLFYVMYGQTEATARMSYLAPDRLPEKIGSMGRAIKGGSFSIDQENSELIYDGPNVYGGYAKVPEDLAFYESNTTLRTGDLARVDEEGFYYITGRMKRFVKLDGSRFSLDELENYLSGHFQKGSFRCLNFDDDYVMTCTTEASLDSKEVVMALASEFKLRPVRVRHQVIDEMPLLPNGKIDDKALKSLVNTGA